MTRLMLALFIVVSCSSSKPLAPTNLPRGGGPGTVNDEPSVKIFVDGNEGIVTVSAGAQVTVSWSSENADYCEVVKADNSAFGSGTSSQGVLTSPLTASTSFMITCARQIPAGEGPVVPLVVGERVVTASAQVIVQAPPVTAFLTIDDAPAADYNFNAAGALRWISSNAESCNLKDPGGNVISTLLNETSIGGKNSGPLLASGTFTLECFGPGGSSRAESKAVANVRPYNVMISANNLSGNVTVTVNAAIPIQWSSAGAASCAVTRNGLPFATGVQSPLGGVSSQPITASTIFVVTCVRPSIEDPARFVGTAASVTVDVLAAPTAELRVDGVLNAKNFAYGAFTQAHPNGPGAMLFWTSTNANACALRREGSSTVIASGLTGNVGVVSLPSGTTVYKLTCSAPGYTDIDRYVTLNVAAPTDHIIFVTHNVWNANLGGLAGADSKCKAAADAVNLRSDRPWKAVLGDTGNSARNRLAIWGNVFAFGRGQIANGFDRFWSTTQEWGAPTAANNDEHAEHVPDTSVATGREVWSGLKMDGTLFSSSSSLTCNNWTSTSGSNYTGDSNQADIDRLHIGIPRTCSSNAHLFCLSQ